MTKFSSSVDWNIRTGGNFHSRSGEVMNSINVLLFIYAFNILPYNMSSVVNWELWKIVVCSNSSTLQGYSAAIVPIWQHFVLNSIMRKPLFDNTEDEVLPAHILLALCLLWKQNNNNKSNTNIGWMNNFKNYSNPAEDLTHSSKNRTKLVFPLKTKVAANWNQTMYNYNKEAELTLKHISKAFKCMSS
jgi:hypothetical protein